MRRIMTAMAVIVLAAAAYAASQYAGRKAYTLTTACTASHSKFSQAVQVASITVKYGTPTANSVFICPVQDGVSSIRYVVGPFTAATSVVYVPENLWMKPEDVLVISNLTSAAASVLIEYTY